MWNNIRKWKEKRWVFFLVFVIFTTILYFYIQDPSSPRSVQSYSSRENGLDKIPQSRKEGPPQASPTSLASSSSATSPSRGKEPPQVDENVLSNKSQSSSFISHPHVQQHFFFFEHISYSVSQWILPFYSGSVVCLSWCARADSYTVTPCNCVVTLFLWVIFSRSSVFHLFTV